MLYSVVHESPVPASQVSGRWSAIVDRALTQGIPLTGIKMRPAFLDALEGRTSSALAGTQTLGLPVDATFAPGSLRFRKQWAAAAAAGALAVAGAGW